MRAAKRILAMLPKHTRAKTLPTSFLSIALISPREMAKLNHRYRRKNRPTDVLSFARLGPDLGDVLICVEIARRNAKENGVSLSDELQMLVVHGILHLFGYDHETNKSAAKRMFRLQNKVLSTLGIAISL